MRILHTADWHLEDRLGRIDRTADLRRGVERLAGYCDEHRVDVLLVAGDLFCERSLPADRTCDALRHLQRTFDGFLSRGGTIVAITGNHDNETTCALLWEAMRLASPASAPAGQLLPGGRFYLADRPSFVKFADPAGLPVQFVLLPYPTSSRYLTADATHRTQDDLQTALHRAAVDDLRQFREHPQFDANQRTVLAAHVHVQGSRFKNLFKMSEREDVLFRADDLPLDWDYVALGHIHRPQALLDLPHVRYAGSIERLDLAEGDEIKGAVLFELGPAGRRGEPLWLPLDARPVYDVVIRAPELDLPMLRDRHPDAAEALVKLDVVYRSGRDNRQAILDELDRLFPRWYYRTCREESTLAPSFDVAALLGRRSFRETVTDYAKAKLAGDDDLPALLGLLDEFLAAEDPA
jgi:exonuclease SbcD